MSPTCRTLCSTVLPIALTIVAGCDDAVERPADGAPSLDAPPSDGAADARGEAGGGGDAGTDAAEDTRSDGGDGGTDADATVDGGEGDAAEDTGSDAEADAWDGAAPEITIDGVLGASEWLGAVAAENDVVSTWGASALRTLYAYVDGTALLVGVDGEIEDSGSLDGNNTILVYVDAASGGVADLASLTDNTGALDAPMSTDYAVPSGFEVDFAWGTRGMGRSPGSVSDDHTGWRDVHTDTANFAFVDPAGAPTVCGADGCETRIPLTTLGAPGTGTIRLFARLTNGVGDVHTSRQALPEDNPDDLLTVTELLVVAY